MARPRPANRVPHPIVEPVEGEWPRSGAAPVRLVRRLTAVPGLVVRTGRDLVRAAAAIPELVAPMALVVGSIETRVARVDAATAHAGSTIDDVDATRADAAVVVHLVHDLMARVRPLLVAVAGIDPDAAVQAGQLLTRSGPLLDQIDSITMPLLGELHDAVPDVRDILPVVRRLEPVMVDVETRIAGLPGADRLRRRGEQLIEQTQPEAT